MSIQADWKGRGTRNRTGRGARARHESRRNRSGDLEEPKEPQVELKGECCDTISTLAGSVVQAKNRIGWDRSVRPNRVHKLVRNKKS